MSVIILRHRRLIAFYHCLVKTHFLTFLSVVIYHYRWPNMLHFANVRSLISDLIERSRFDSVICSTVFINCLNNGQKQKNKKKKKKNGFVQNIAPHCNVISPIDQDVTFWFIRAVKGTIPHQ